MVSVFAFFADLNEGVCLDGFVGDGQDWWRRQANVEDYGLIGEGASYGGSQRTHTSFTLERTDIDNDIVFAERELKDAL